jgi:3',5'-cyclic AMP phosphodiesterase CpdA
VIPGNHDDREAMRQCFSDHAYLPRSSFLHYAIEEWPLRLVCLDSVVAGASAGALCEERLDWLDRTLAQQPGRPTLVFLHHPPFASGIAGMDCDALAQPARLEAVIARHRQVERVVCGHLHRAMHCRFGGTVASSCPSTAHQIALDLEGATGGASPARYVLEPPGFQLHLWTRAGLVTHNVPTGRFGGPFAFSG